MSGQGLVTAAVNNVSGTTQNTSIQTSCLARRSDHLAFTVVYSVLFLVGLILNGFILWFHCCQPLRSSSKSLMIYLKNLTVADFLLCLSLPLRVIENATSSAAAHLLYCSFGASMLFLNMYASILFMGYIAWNRYEKVVHPFRNCFLLSARTACIISTATWVFLLVPVTTYMTMLLNDGRQQRSTDCSCEDFHSELLREIYRASHFCAFTTFLLVLISMIFSYYRTSRKLLHADQRQSSSFSSKKLLRSRKKMLVLVCVFCVSFAPYHLVRLPLMFYQEAVFVKLFYYPLQLATIMSVLNVCLDPLVYFFLCKDFRVQVKLRLRGFRVIHQRVNAARTEGEAQLRNMDINNEVSFSTTSRSNCEL